jgi:hypothetical protein
MIANIRSRGLLVALLLLVGPGLSLLEGADQKRSMSAVFIDTPMVLDGRLDEPAWDLAQPASDFIQQDPVMDGRATERTEVRLLYDKDNLYVGVYCFDSAGRAGLVVNDLTRDYSSFQGDHFGMALDTFDDDRNGFFFSTNPGGAKRDAQFGSNGANSNFDWDGIWQVKTLISESGWQVEMVIPFKTLRFRELKEQIWGVNFVRRIRRKNEVNHWSPVARPYRIGRISLAGILEGVGGVRQGRNLYLKPYVSAPIVRRQDDDVDFQPELGMDLKYGITPGVTLDLTVNTDFAQVEADQQQINLTRFPLFFPEKREFFLENATVFRVKRVGSGFRSNNRDLIAFFSRRIGLSEGEVVPIVGGARLTGRAGKYQLGFLSMQTDGLESTPSTNFSVARVRRDLLQNSDLGGIFINKHEAGGRTNRTYGVDSNFLFFRYLEAAAFLLKTDTEGLEGKDKAFHTFVGWNDPFYDVQVEYLSIEDNFNPEAGFVPRVGIRRSRGEFGIRPRPGETIPWLRELRPSMGLEYITNQENVFQSRDFDQTLSFDLHDGGRGWFTHRFRFERLEVPFFIRPGQTIEAGDYWFQEITTSFTSDPSRMFSGNFFLRSGGFFDGHQHSLTTGFLFQPGYRFGANLSWTHDNVDLPSGDFDTDLVRARLNYSFSTRMFLNALIQYNSTLQEFSSNLRFNFIYRPLNDLFVVYNERRATTGEVRERALIVKLTYLFDF